MRGQTGWALAKSVQSLVHAGFGFVAEAFERGLEQWGGDAG
jgi:hypothetical protein